jgi:phosphate transport system permease protein
MKLRLLKDRAAGRLMMVLTVIGCLLVVVIGVALYFKSRPILAAKPLLVLLTSGTWLPWQMEFGFYPFIIGTVWVTVLSMILAVPPCLLVAIFLSEYAWPRLRDTLKPLIDLLAGIPSVVYGVWGIVTVVPLIRDRLVPLTDKYLAGNPLFASTNPSGYCVLAGGIVLAIMIFPVIISVSEEVLRTVPFQLREAGLALGATKWQVIKTVVLRKAMPGVFAAIILGLSRAFGETMAVLMVAGNVPMIPRSVYDPGYPLPALIANNYGEMMSIPLYDSALMSAALVLMLVILVFNIIGRIVLLRIVRRSM